MADEPRKPCAVEDDGPPVSAFLFLEVLGSLERQHGPKLVSGPEGGFHPNLDAIRRHMGSAEALFRGLPSGPAEPGAGRAADLDRFAEVVGQIRRESNDFGSEAFPPHFWESCEEIEGYIAKAAEKLRAEGA